MVPSSLLDGQATLPAEADPELAEVIKMFPAQDPGVLAELFKQCGRNKETLVEMLLNEGRPADDLQVAADLQARELVRAQQEEGSEESDEARIQELVGGVDQSADEDTIAKQVAQIEKAHKRKEAEQKRRDEELARRLELGLDAEEEEDPSLRLAREL